MYQYKVDSDLVFDEEILVLPAETIEHFILNDTLRNNKVSLHGEIVYNNPSVSYGQ